MLSINKKKYLKSLSNKKYRLLENKILIEGLRIMEEAINSKLIFEHIWFSNKYDGESNKISLLVEQIKKNNIPYTFEKEKDMQSISNTQHSQGILGLINVSNIFNKDLNYFSDRIIILDQISDPGNLGTIIRTCSWFGIESIILTKSSADIFNPKCLRSGMGGHFHIKDCAYLSEDEIIQFFSSHQYTLYCATMTGESIYNIKNNDKWALVLGSEAHGINKKLLLGNKVSIPKHGKIECLNVSIAAGIIMNQLINKK